MKPISHIPRKPSNKFISALTSIMLLMAVMASVSPADAGRLNQGPQQLTALKSAPGSGQTAASGKALASSVRSKSVRPLYSTYGMGVDVNGGGTGGNPSMPGVSNQPASNGKVNCINRYAPGRNGGKGCGCQEDKLSSLMTFNCKNPKPSGKPNSSIPGFMSESMGNAGSFGSSIGGHLNSAAESLAEHTREVCTYKFHSSVNDGVRMTISFNLGIGFMTHEQAVAQGYMYKECKTVYVD